MNRSSKGGNDFLQLEEIEEFGEQTRPAIGNDVIDALREVGLSLGEGDRRPHRVAAPGALSRVDVRPDEGAPLLCAGRPPARAHVA